MRSRKSFERQEGVKSGRLIVIAAEGRETENIYFEAMKAFMHASDIHIEVLRRETNNSSPEEVYRQIKGFVTEYDLDDEIAEYSEEYLLDVKQELIDELQEELTKVFREWEERNGYKNTSFVIFETINPFENKV